MRYTIVTRDGFSTTPVERPANLPLHVVIFHFLKRPLHERLLVLTELELLDTLHLKSGEDDLDLMYYAFFTTIHFFSSKW